MATQDIFKRMYAKKGVCPVCGGIGGIHCTDLYPGSKKKIVRGGKFKKALRRMARRRLTQIEIE